MGDGYYMQDVLSFIVKSGLETVLENFFLFVWGGFLELWQEVCEDDVTVTTVMVLVRNLDTSCFICRFAPLVFQFMFLCFLFFVILLVSHFPPVYLVMCVLSLWVDSLLSFVFIVFFPVCACSSSLLFLDSWLKSVLLFLRLFFSTWI